MKKKLVSKILRLISLKHASKQAEPEPEKAAPRRRARSSQSSALSNFEPMPTIVEETESEWSNPPPDDLMMVDKSGNVVDEHEPESSRTKWSDLARIPQPTFQLGAILMISPPFVEL